MKIKTPYFNIEIEIIFVIVLIISILSTKINNFLSSFYMCYLFILFHELAHILVASIFGKDVDTLKISLAGVSVRFCEKKYTLVNNKYNKKKIFKNIFIYIAGPLSNIIMAVIFINNKFIFEINMFFCLLNLIPIYPLDGYNILSNILLLILKYNRVEVIIEIISKILIIIIISISIIQLLYFKNISIIIFVTYIIILKKQRNESIKNIKILQKM